MNNKNKEIPEVKCLRWVANMIPYFSHPRDDRERLANAIHVYCTAGADKIEELHDLLMFVKDAPLSEVESENKEYNPFE